MIEEFFESLFAGPERLDVLSRRLGLALAFGFAVAGIYWATHRRDGNRSPTFVSTLVLLAVLIAMVTQVVGDELARAFALVGALSIVRFRTVVEDTRDTAFVIFAVIVGMAAGADQPRVALLGLCVGGAAAVLTRPRRPAVGHGYWTLNVRVGLTHGPDEVLGRFFREHAEECQLLATVTARQGAALELTYKVRLRPASAPTAVVAELNRLEGVQNVELRRL